MRILHIYDKNSFGGVATIIECLRSRKMADQYFYCLRNTGSDEVSDSEYSFYSRSKNRVSILPFLKLIRLVKFTNAEILHSHQNKSLLFSVAYKLLVSRNIKIVQHEHGGINQGSLLYHLELRFLSKYIDRFITVSRSILDALKNDYGIDDRKLIYLPNFFSGKINPQESRSIEAGGFNVGFAGRMEVSKGCYEFIEAAGMFTGKDVTFLMAGDGREREGIWKSIEDSPNSERIKYLGQVTDMEAFYSRLNCFVLPSHREGMSMVQLEVMAKGIPLIVSDAPGLNEIGIENHNCLFSEVGDAKSISEKIEMIRSSPDLAKTLSANEISTVRRFTVDNFIGKLEDIYAATR